METISLSEIMLNSSLIPVQSAVITLAIMHHIQSPAFIPHHELRHESRCLRVEDRALLLLHSLLLLLLPEPQEVAQSGHVVVIVVGHVGGLVEQSPGTDITICQLQYLFFSFVDMYLASALFPHEGVKLTDLLDVTDEAWVWADTRQATRANTTARRVMVFYW